MKIFNANAVYVVARKCTCVCLYFIFKVLNYLENIL